MVPVALNANLVFHSSLRLFYKAFVDASSPPKAAVTFIHKCGEQGGPNDKLLSEAINFFCSLVGGS
jgi:hypothetical protein